MCRLVGYIGQEALLLNELLDKPKNSLIKQSMGAQEGEHIINADGFGLAWYNRKIEVEPGVFKSIQPAWGERNLRHISRKIKSDCFMAHIRSSTIGDVTVNNCHPFSYEKYSFVHNGTINGFSNIRKDLINELDNEMLENVKAQTDSEHLFFLIMQFLKNDKEKNLLHAVKKAFVWIESKQEILDDKNFAYLNILISDGKEMLATKYVTKNKSPYSLYYWHSERKNVLENDHALNSCIIASEPLNDYKEHWEEVPKNHYLLVKNDGSLITLEGLI